MDCAGRGALQGLLYGESPVRAHIPGRDVQVICGIVTWECRPRQSVRTKEIVFERAGKALDWVRMLIIVCGL
jgi:hypothetical protein